MAYSGPIAFPVIEGGTADTSFTAYAPICGGTTTTGALQSASTGISSSGFVLTSNGAAALPSFKSISSIAVPAFMVYMTNVVSSITGDGTVYDMLFDTLNFDALSNVTLNSSGTTIFTCPSTGYYFFTFGVKFNGIVSNNADFTTIIENFTQGTTWQAPQGMLPVIGVGNTGNTYGVSNSIALPCNASDQVIVNCTVHGTTTTTSILGKSGNNISTYWAGFQII